VYLVIGVVVAALIIGEVAADVVNSGHRASRVAAQTYVVEVIPVIDESTMLASTMHLVRNSAATLARRGLESALGRLVAGTESNLQELGMLGVPAPSSRSHELLEAALAARAKGARMLTGGISVATGPAASQAGAKATSLIVAAGREMMLGDQSYRSFVLSLPRSSGRSRLPASTWVSDPAAWTTAAVTTWVSQLSSRADLRIHQDLTIVAITVQPPVVRITGLPTTTTTTSSTTTTSTSTSTTTSTSTSTTTTSVPGTTTSSTTTSTSTTTTSTSTTTTTMQLPPSGSTSVLPPTQGVSVVLVVVNAGNVPLSAIWASASVVGEPSAGRHGEPAPPTHSAAVRIGRLAPGASVEVTLPVLSVVSGRLYTLLASIGTGPLPTGPVTSPPKGPGQLDKVKIKVAAE
jgi:hypothetical protein